MPADTTVKYFHSGMLGAPAMNGVAAALIAVLDACLVNGFSSQTADSVAIASGVGTVNRASGHPFEVGVVAALAGATVTGGSINGQHRVLSIGATSWTFDATGLPDQSATGTITQKVAAAGWAKTFTGTNLAAYKSVDVAATGCLMRVDDAGTTNARVVGYASMTDVNTGLLPFPTAAQVSGGCFWVKSSTADATLRSWVLVGDQRGFTMFVNYGGATSSITMAFGDFESKRPSDAFGCQLCAPSNSIAGNTNTSLDLAYINSVSAQEQWAPRGVAGVGSAVQLRRSAVVPCGTASGVFSGSTSSAFVAYPNLADNGFYVSPMTLAEFSASNYCLRGLMPGVYFSAQAIGTAVFATRDKVSGITALPGRSLMALVNGTGPLFVDITGPWR